MTLGDLKLYKLEFSENFAGFRRFGRQQWRDRIVSESVVTHWM